MQVKALSVLTDVALKYYHSRTPIGPQSREIYNLEKPHASTFKSIDSISLVTNQQLEEKLSSELFIFKLKQVRNKSYCVKS